MYIAIKNKTLINNANTDLDDSLLLLTIRLPNK